MRRQDKYKNIQQANLMLENRYLKSKGLLKEGEYDAPITDLKLNDKWKILKLKLDNTAISDVEKEKILNLIKNQSEQLYNKSLEYLNTLKTKKTKTADYFKQKQQQEKEGKKFEPQISPNGIKLFWDNIGNNYAIYFPIDDVEKQRIDFSADEKEFSQNVFNRILNYEKQKKYSQEEIYDIIDTLLPTLRRNF